MTLAQHVRRCLLRRLTGENRLVFDGGRPAIERGLRGTSELGLYLHIPFCRRICPYCPYSKTTYRSELARRYTRAVLREIDLYAGLVGDRLVTSFYVGGGTPTTMLASGLDQILERVFARFRMGCSVHMESHPNDLTPRALATLRDLGVEHLSIGVEALQDRHLRALGRPYTASRATTAVASAVAAGFRCVSADMMFALPGQEIGEIERTARTLVTLGADQVAAYPLFGFPHTAPPRTDGPSSGLKGLLLRRRMLRVLEQIFRDAGYRRSSVWAFTRPEAPAYCSVTVPLYVGLGASGGSYLRDVFYVNTFDVGTYVDSLERDRSPVALRLELSEPMQMAGWLYWRLYETRFRKEAFHRRFGVAFDRVYGPQVTLLGAAGLLRDDGREVVLTDAGAYWLHAVQDLFSLDAVSRLWAEAAITPWPETITL